MTPRVFVVAGISSFLFAVAAVALLAGGCPTSPLTGLGGGLTDPNTTTGGGTSGGGTSTTGGSTTTGGTDTSGTTGGTSGNTGTDPTCPSGQFLLSDGTCHDCASASCPDGQYLGYDGNCYPSPAGCPNYTGGDVPTVAPGMFPATIEYRQTMTVLVNVADVDDYFADQGHACGYPVVSADGSTVAFYSWVDWGLSQTEVTAHIYVMNADGTGLTDLTSAMPANMVPRTPQRMLLNDDGSRLFTRYYSTIYYIDLPSGVWTPAIADAAWVSMAGYIKAFTINSEGTRMYFTHIPGWNQGHLDQGIYYADLGGSPVSLMQMDELPLPTEGGMNCLSLAGTAPDDTVLFTWIENCCDGESLGLWKVGPGPGATRVASETHYWGYGDVPSKIVSADGSKVLYTWGSAAGEVQLNLIDLNTLAATTLASSTSGASFSDLALSGDGRYARYGITYAFFNLLDLQTGDRRAIHPRHTDFYTSDAMSDLTYDGRYQYERNGACTKIYRTDFRPGAGPYTAAPSISAIAFSAEELPNDNGVTKIVATATVSGPQSRDTLTAVHWVAMVDTLEIADSTSPLSSGGTEWLYDDGTHGDEVAGDGVFTVMINTSTWGVSACNLTLPYDCGFRVLAIDAAGNYSVADTKLTIVAP